LIISAPGIGAVLVVTIELFLNLTGPRVDDQGGERNHGKIVFSGRFNSTTHQIFIVNADGSGLMKWTGGDDLWHFDPVPSPDGSKIAYETWNSFPNAPVGGKIIQHLFTMNVDGKDKIRLTPPEGVMTSSVFSWSPDSKRITYESSEDIYVVSADGINTVRLTHDSKPISERGRIDNHNPFWSNNGTIIFRSTIFDGIEPKAAGFREINPDGTDLKSLFDFDF